MPGVLIFIAQTVTHFFQVMRILYGCSPTGGSYGFRSYHRTAQTDVNYRETQACALKRQTAERMQVISKRNLCRDMTHRERERTKTERGKKREKERLLVIPG